MEIGLQIADVTWSGGAPELGPRLAEHAREAEDAGVTRITVMDHPVAFRSPGMLAKQVSALDVLSGGRAGLGIGAGGSVDESQNHSDNETKESAWSARRHSSWGLLARSGSGSPGS